MKLFISADLNTGNSGDIIASKELEFLKEFNDKTPNQEVIQLGFDKIHPSRNNLPDNPFLIDYITCHRLFDIDLSKISICHFYGGNFGVTVKYLKLNNVKTTMTEMFHNRQISITEHEKLYGLNSYPFQHVKDDKLYQLLIRSIRDVDVIITGGSAPKKSILKEIPNTKVEIIPHGCNIPTEDKIKSIPNEFRIGYIGAQGPDKGLRYLFEGWSKLDYKDSVLILAGKNSEHLDQFIKCFAKTGKFHLLGFVDNIADFYNNLSVYVQPSATEGFGLEVLEAMSYGRPVICSDGAGAADCITNKIDGFVVPAMNSNYIAEKLQYFKDNPNEIIRIGKNAREKAKKYSWNKIKEYYFRTWKSLLNE